VHKALDLRGARARALERLVNGRHHPLGLVARGGGRLAGDQPVAGDEGGVGEGPADVHPEDHGAGR
jgi:hypothetical protein